MAKKFLSYDGLKKLKQEIDIAYATKEHTHDNTYLKISDAARTYAKKADIVSVYKAKGSIPFEYLPLASEASVGDVYNITNDFTTNNYFVEGMGKNYPAGANVVCVDSSGIKLWDVLGSGGAIEEITDTEIEELFDIYSVNATGLNGEDNQGQSVNITYEEVEETCQTLIIKKYY